MHAPTISAIDYQNLFASVPGLYLILSPDLVIMEASKAYLRSTLTDRESIIGKYVFDAFPENPATAEHHGAENVRKALLQVLNRGTAHTMPIQRYDIPRPASLGGGFEERHWLISNHPVFDKNGKLQHIVHQVIDVTMQQMAHRHIETSRERVEILAQATTDVIWDVDLLNDHIWWSESLTNVFGYDIHELPVHKSWAECVHPEDQERVVTGINSVIERGGKTWTDSYRFRRKDGTYADVIERGYIMRDEKGIAYRMIGCMFDVTDQLNIERKLKTSNDRFQLLLDAMPNLAWCSEPGFGPGSGITYLNKAWYDYTGLPYGLLGGGEKVIHPLDLQNVTEGWIKSQHDSQPYQQELRLKNLQNGHYRWFLVRAVPIYDDFGKINLWLGTCTDIDDQKKATQHEREIVTELLKTKEQFEFLADTIPQLVWTTLPDGFHDYFNKRWTEYTGYTLENSLGSDMWNNLLHPDDQERARKRWQHSLDSGEFYEIEYRFKSTEGTYRWFLGQAMPMRNEKGEIMKWFGTCTDIEDHVRTENELLSKNEELRRINQDLDNFVYTASHDLKLPIINMAGIFEELTNSAEFKDPDAAQLINLFDKSLKQIHGTINDLSEIVKVQKNLEDIREAVSLQQITDEVCLSIQDQIGETDASIYLDFSAAPTVWFSPVNLRSVLYNLISNSLKYAFPERKPQIWLSSELAGDFILLTVQDNGLGIDLNKHGEKVFQMFRRFHNHVQGTGIGLYLLHRLVTNNGGRVEIASTVNEGTTFKIFFKNKPE
jgi:PAS domain S-box-containing protein